MSDSPQRAAAAPAPAPYTPSGAAASERMVSSVLGRVIGPYGSPIGRALRFADGPDEVHRHQLGRLELAKYG